MKLQQTLISLYGKKTEAFNAYISGILSILKDSGLGRSISFYEPEQVHATLIGMEAVEESGRLINLNLLEKEGRREEMHFDRMQEVINRYLPMEIRLGGFQSADQDFLSWGKCPWERSFSIDLAQKRIIVVGWPHKESDFSENGLLNFRDDMGTTCHIRHKYTGDNDFYLVLGELAETSVIPSVDILSIEKKVRTYMSVHILDITISDLYRVAYLDPRLPLETTRVFPDLIP